jgi:hypothetical protein
MPRIKLAYWHAEHAPGDEIDVDDESLAALQRDGRVAEVVEPKLSEPEPAPEPAESAPETGRRRR